MEKEQPSKSRRGKRARKGPCSLWSTKPASSPGSPVPVQEGIVSGKMVSAAHMPVTHLAGQSLVSKRDWVGNGPSSGRGSGDPGLGTVLQPHPMEHE